MTRKDIIRMAREAGIDFDPQWGTCCTGNFQIERLAHAAYEAGAAAENEALCRWIEAEFASYDRADAIVAAIRARRKK